MNNERIPYGEISSIPLVVYTMLAAALRASQFALLLCQILCQGKVTIGCTIGDHKIQNKLSVIDQRYEDLAHEMRNNKDINMCQRYEKGVIVSCKTEKRTYI
jgi:hypothetical protein